ncbi:glycosyltransferase family 2 protein [Microbacterium deminutum]|uniref:Glycosyltransferase 2-like domain-containing protein n=1 Tax=Microbacterium deminutum TaxID=344164 RepID=A0ABN2QMS8_9MICO
MSVRMKAKPIVGYPKVSVVIPHYNYGEYLPVALESVLSQEGVDLEVLIVDDASTDGSLRIAREQASADHRVILIEHEHNMRHIATYNDGLARASGEFVVLLSADDALAPGSLARAAALFQAEPEVNLVYGPVEEFASVLPSSTSHQVSWTTWTSDEWIGRVCRRGRNIIVNPEAMIRRRLVDELGGYDPELPHSADMYLWMRAAARGKVARVNGPTQAFYRQHDSNMHATEFGGRLDDLSAVRKTFEMLFRVDGSRLQKATSLSATADKAVAREALRMSVSVSGPSAKAHRSALISFATETGAPAWSCALYEIVPKLGLTAIFKRFESARWSARYRRHRRYGT